MWRRDIVMHTLVPRGGLPRFFWITFWIAFYTAVFALQQDLAISRLDIIQKPIGFERSQHDIRLRRLIDPRLFFNEFHAALRPARERERPEAGTGLAATRERIVGTPRLFTDSLRSLS